MAVSTLSKFTVPLASDQSASSQGLLMPKLQYRFRVVLENFGISTPRSEITKQVVDCSRPNLTFDQITLEAYNSRVFHTVRCLNMRQTVQMCPVWLECLRHYHHLVFLFLL